MSPSQRRRRARSKGGRCRLLGRGPTVAPDRRVLFRCVSAGALFGPSFADSWFSFSTIRAVSNFVNGMAPDSWTYVFFSPKLPISDKERDWVDASFDRLIDLFGRERLGRIGGARAAASGTWRSTVVLPNLDFFTREWEP